MRYLLVVCSFVLAVSLTSCKKQLDENKAPQPATEMMQQSDSSAMMQDSTMMDSSMNHGVMGDDNNMGDTE